MDPVETANAVLDAALSSTDDTHLRYDPAHLPALRQQILDFIETYPKTIPLKIGEYTAKDGTEHRLLLLHGVVPMRYKFDVYNIPLSIWIPPKFPQAPPVAYVNRNDQFVFNPRCAVLDAAQNGRIVTDYLKNWASPESNLKDFMVDLKVWCADSPLLYQAPNAGPE